MNVPLKRGKTETYYYLLCELEYKQGSRDAARAVELFDGPGEESTDLS